LRRGLDAAKVGNSEKVDAFRRLDRFTRAVEHSYDPKADFPKALSHEQAISLSVGGRTVFDDRKKRREEKSQLTLF
jgi:hypothetical protein